MIVVDSSVWVDFFNGRRTSQVVRLYALLGEQRILIGDLVLCEILQGFRSEPEAIRVLNYLSALDFTPMVGREVAVKAAENYRTLRRLGVTVRKTIDLLIGTFCIEHRHVLLHSDRDFDPMARHLGLQTL